MTDLQKVVVELEAKTGNQLSTERSKMELVIAEARKQAMDEILLTLNSQQESTEVRKKKDFNLHINFLFIVLIFSTFHEDI